MLKTSHMWSLQPNTAKVPPCPWSRISRRTSIPMPALVRIVTPEKSKRKNRPPAPARSDASSHRRSAVTTSTAPWRRTMKPPSISRSGSNITCIPGLPPGTDSTLRGSGRRSEFSGECTTDTTGRIGTTSRVFGWRAATALDSRGTVGGTGEHSVHATPPDEQEWRVRSYLHARVSR